MAITVKLMHPLFVGEVQDVDLSQPMSDETFAEIQKAIDDNAVLVFHGPKLDEDQQAWTDNESSLLLRQLFLTQLARSTRRDVQRS